MSLILYTRTGKTFVTGAELGHGGEGTVLETRGDPSRCIKLYASPIPEPTLGKLSVMVANPPLDPTLGNSRHHSIAWPEQLLFKTPGCTAFAGFLMSRVDGKVFRTALSYLTPDARVKALGGVFNWKYLYTAAINVASSVGALHEKGYCIGDLNESNLLIASSALITIIDCDSFQVPDPATGKTYRCLVGKPEFTAPELQGRYGEIDRTLPTDRFALGVLLFQLLMEGTHPYQARGEAVEDLPSTQQKILKGLFPYARGAQGVSPPAFAPPFGLLDPQIQKLFLRCFEAGHGNPAARPSAREWYDTLRGRESLLRTCPHNDNHIYFSHLERCPWCERAQALMRDSFPSSLGMQIALAEARAPLASVASRLGPLRGLVALALADGAVTSQEREYLINRGLELRLTKAEVETLLDGEIRRAGAKRFGLPARKVVWSGANAPRPVKPGVWTRKLTFLKLRIWLLAGGAILAVAVVPFAKSMILDLPETPAPAPAPRFSVVVTADSADLLSRPDLEARVLERASRGTVLEVDYASETWFRVVRQETRQWVYHDQAQRVASAPGESP